MTPEFGPSCSLNSLTTHCDKQDEGQTLHMQRRDENKKHDAGKDCLFTMRASIGPCAVTISATVMCTGACVFFFSKVILAASLTW